MVEPFIAYYDEVEFGEDQFENWHPHENNLNRTMLTFVIGISFKNDPRKAMGLYDFYLVHEDFFDKHDKTGNVPYWIVKDEFNWKKVYRSLEYFVKSCTSNSEEECFENLRRKFFWEYDGYNGEEDIPPKDMLNFIC
jgi:hypothetical protein